MAEAGFQFQTSEEWAEFSSPEYDLHARRDFLTPVEFAESPPRKCQLSKLSQKVSMYLENSQIFDKDGICDEYLSDLESNFVSSSIWAAISGTYGIPPVIFFRESRICSLYSENSCHNNKDKITFDESELISDDLYDLMDMHKLMAHASETSTEQYATTSIQTADEVIEELEEILQISEIGAVEDQASGDNSIVFDLADDFNDLTPVDVIDEFDAAILDESDNERSKSLKRMHAEQLNGLLTELESSVRSLSESLLAELNLRDELLYEKEVRNAFITKILEVQYKQERFQQGSAPMTKFGRLKKSFSASNTSDLTSGRFLTTVIPFDIDTSPSLENLVVLIRLLDAIKRDSDDVPALITNYILNVLCPAESRFDKFEL